MKITLKLFATLSDYLPDGAVRNTVRVEVPEDATVSWVIDRYHLPRELVHLVLVNGTFAPQDQRDQTPLRDGDTLAIWPPVAGG